MKVKGRVPRSWMPASAFTVPLLKDQFLVGLLDEDLEELALDFKTGLMDLCFDLVGEMFVLVGHGQSHPQTEIE